MPSPFFTLKPFLNSNFHSFIHPVVDILQNSHVEASLKLLVSAFISFYMCTHTEPLASFTSLCQDLCHFWLVQNLQSLLSPLIMQLTLLPFVGSTNSIFGVLPDRQGKVDKLYHQPHVEPGSIQLRPISKRPLPTLDSNQYRKWGASNIHIFFQSKENIAIGCGKVISLVSFFYDSISSTDILWSSLFSGMLIYMCMWYCIAKGGKIQCLCS